MQNIVVYGTILYDNIQDEYFIGGCNTNVAAHCAKLGMDTTMVSCVGNDKLGKNSIEWMQTIGIHTEYIQKTSQYPTGTVEVDLSNPSNPQYVLEDFVAYDFIRLNDEQLDVLSKKEFDFLYFGTVEQRHDVSTATLRKLLERVHVKHVFFDMNLRKDCFTIPMLIDSMKCTDILKMNEEELAFLGKNVLNIEGTESQVVCTLMSSFPIKVLIVTRGEHGASAYCSGKRIDVDSVPVEVVDTVGAGDAFAAAFISAFAGGADMEAALRAGALLGSYVAGKRSAIPEYTDKLEEQMKEYMTKGQDISCFQISERENV